MPLFECPAERKGALEEVKAAVGIRHTYLDGWIYLFLANKQFDVNETVAKLRRRDAKERDDFAASTITPSLRQSMSSGIVQYVGEDRNGRAVLYFTTSRDFPRTAERAERTASLNMWLSWAARLRRENPSCTVTWVVNQKGASFRKNVDLLFQKDMALHISKFFPGVIAKLFLCNMSSALSFVLKPLLRQLPAGLRDTIHIFSSDDIARGQLHEFIDPSVLPADVGGTNDCDTPANWSEFAARTEAYFNACLEGFKKGRGVKESEVRWLYGVDPANQPVGESATAEGAAVGGGEKERVIVDVGRPVDGSSQPPMFPRSDADQLGAEDARLLGSVEDRVEHVSGTLPSSLADDVGWQPAEAPPSLLAFEVVGAMDVGRREAPPHFGQSNGMRQAEPPSPAPGASSSPHVDVEVGLRRVSESTGSSFAASVDPATILEAHTFLLVQLPRLLKELQLGLVDGDRLHGLQRRLPEMERAFHGVWRSCRGVRGSSNTTFNFRRFIEDGVVDVCRVPTPSLVGEVVSTDERSGGTSHLAALIRRSVADYREWGEGQLEWVRAVERMLQRLTLRWPTGMGREAVMRELSSLGQRAWGELSSALRRYQESTTAMAIAEFVRYHKLLRAGGKLDTKSKWFCELFGNMLRYRESTRRGWLFCVYPPGAGDMGLEVEGLHASPVPPPTMEELLDNAGEAHDLPAVGRLLLTAESLLQKRIGELELCNREDTSLYRAVQEFLDASAAASLPIRDEDQVDGSEPSEMLRWELEVAKDLLGSAMDPLHDFLFAQTGLFLLRIEVVHEGHAEALADLQAVRTQMGDVSRSVEGGGSVAAALSAVVERTVNDVPTSGAPHRPADDGADAESLTPLSEFDESDHFQLSLLLALLVASLQEYPVVTAASGTAPGTPVKRRTLSGITDLGSDADVDVAACCRAIRHISAWEEGVTGGV